MGKGRLEAFSNGVIAVIITIMVLEMKVPRGIDAASLAPVLPVFLTYVLSFVFIGIYWNTHHHLFHAVQRVNGVALWANLHLLFWLSLAPFVTAWAGASHFAPLPVAAYGVVLLGAAFAYYVLTRVLLGAHGKDSLVARALPGPALREATGREALSASLSSRSSTPWRSIPVVITPLPVSEGRDSLCAATTRRRARSHPSETQRRVVPLYGRYVRPVPLPPSTLKTSPVMNVSAAAPE